MDQRAGGAVGHVLAQVVRYEYSSPVTDLRQRLVVLPPEVHGGQRRVRHEFSVRGGEGATWVTRSDRWGNTVIDVQVPTVERAVEFVIDAGTAVDAKPHAVSSIGRFVPPTHLTHPPAEGPIAAMASAARDADARAICSMVHRSLEYRPGITGVRTTAAEAAAGGVGVCQDFAHVMLAVCRSVGLPARYVSGHLAGEGASHAWVETLTPVNAGRRARFAVEAWDPTHDRRTDERYLTVATGRDYDDVAPLSGTFEADELVDATLTVTKTLSVEAGP